MSPLPGDFGTVATTGWAAQLIRWGTRSDINHAFLLYDVEDGHQRILEMGPDGLKLNIYHYRPKFTHWSTVPLSSTERSRIIDIMKTRLEAHLTYNWIADAYLGLRDRPRIKMPRWVWKLHARISPNQFQCAQLVDYVYLKAGVHLFDDGRDPGQVAPSDLRKLSLDT
jgi:hypothetical protein